ncbi:hypothetical protein PPUJ21368_15650 [Pseudomonas putida]|nr:hypothetical protein PPUJ21368_15650 [Pseudomonas putida]
MLPLLLKIFNQFETQSGTKLKFINNYAEVEFNKVFSHLNEHLNNKKFLVEERLTGADFMLGFVVKSALNLLKSKSEFPHIENYIKTLENQTSYKLALIIDAK